MGHLPTNKGLLECIDITTPENHFPAFVNKRYPQCLCIMLYRMWRGAWCLKQPLGDHPQQPCNLGSNSQPSQKFRLERTGTNQTNPRQGEVNTPTATAVIMKIVAAFGFFLIAVLGCFQTFITLRGYSPCGRRIVVSKQAHITMHSHTAFV